MKLVVNRGWPSEWYAYPAAALIKLVQWDSAYHCGIVIGETLYESRLTMGVSRSPPPVGWEEHDLDGDEREAIRYFIVRERNEYDIRGLLDWALRRAALTLGFRIRPMVEDPKREFCSELSAGMLGLANPVQYSPSALVRAVVDRAN